MTSSMQIDRPLLDRICGEYREMPALRLTVGQASRLWALDRALCASALDALVQERCLRQTPDGLYARRGAGEEVCSWRRGVSK